MTLTRRAFARQAAAAGTLLLPGCGPSPRLRPRPPGLLTFVLSGEPIAFSAIAFSGPSRQTSPKINEGLVAIDLTGRPVPQLATAWQVSPDFRTYTFALRKNVRWHDGTPFTSADVACSIAILKAHHPYGTSTLADVETVDTPDPHVAVIRLARPAPVLLGALRAEFSPIVPAHLYADADPLDNPHNNHPIGTGPFRFVAWERGSHALLVRNPDYWDAPRPYVDRVLMRFVGDAGARIAMLETGEIDLIGGSPVPPNEFARVAALPHLRVETQGYGWMGAMSQLVFNLDRPWARDVRVRQAVAHAIDAQAMLDTIWYGRGRAVTGPIAPALHAFYDPEAPRYPHDRARAERLLDAAGHPRGPDGVRFRITHDYLPYGDGYKQQAQFLRSSLGKVGIALDLRNQDFSAYVRRLYTERDFDLGHISAANDFDPTVGVQKMYLSGSYHPGVPFSNGAHYRNPDVDALLSRAAIETDPQARAALYRRFQVVASTDLPQLGLMSLDSYTLRHRRVSGDCATMDGLAGNFAHVRLAPEHGA
jgi:peptide/nickel transport system substrate-binding protein